MNDPSSSSIPACPRCAELLKRVAELEALVRELQERLNQNSSNSSIPPSANPLGAPKPVVKAPSGRKPGGQQGHPGHHRHRFPPERVHKVVPYVPTICTQCQAPLPAEPGPGDPEPSWHQLAELPELAAIITEHQGHTRRCLCCGHLNRGQIPPEIRAHVIGPRLAAVMSHFSGRHHTGRRSVEKIVGQLPTTNATSGGVEDWSRKTIAETVGCRGFQGRGIRTESQRCRLSLLLRSERS